MTKLRYTMFAMTIFLVLALSAMSTVPALADDTTPPPTETPTVETPPTEEVIEEAPPVEEIPVAEIPVVEETIPEETAEVEETVAELLTQVPDGTELVVVNEEGETVPLVSEEAAELIEIIDPMWCPVGVNPGTATCSIGYTSLTQLVADFNDGANGLTAFAPSGNGVIWIQKNADSGAAGTTIEINGSIGAFTGIANFSLTLKGGWNGCNPVCTNTVDTGSPSIFDQSLSIINWTGEITLSDITISGVTSGIPASNNAVLNIDTEKKITLTNVKVINNTGTGIINGAFLDNMDDSYVSDVVITNSNFNDNLFVGLTVNSDGAITLANVLANGNDAGGANLNNGNAATAKAVSITTGINSFSNNIGNIGSISGAGLVIVSTGVITLKDITANNNGAEGIYIDNRPGSSAVGITFTGTTIASENGGDGIRAYSDGVITASNLVTNSNGTRGTGFGAYLANNSALTPLGITISGSSNQFKFNRGTGLAVLSNGAITLNSITASNNHDAGAAVVNSDFFNGSANVTLTGTNVFNENFTDGLEIWSDGMITVSNLTANNNGAHPSGLGHGAWLANSGASTAKSVTLIGHSSFTGNDFYGLFIQSLGNINIATLTANSNAGGARLENFEGLGNVTISSAVVATGNGTYGLNIVSKGVITLNGVTANYNDGDGVYIKNDTAPTPKAVTINGSSNNFNYNGTGGLEILSLGSVTLNNIFAYNNTNGPGLYVDNCSWNGSSCSGTGGITLNGTSGFFSNGDSGMEMYSTGNILIKDLDSNGNGTSGLSGNAGYGAYLKNSYAGAMGNVTVGTNRANWLNGFSNNFFSGLEIFSNGTVTLSNITANNNGGASAFGYGLYVYNIDAATPKAVTLNGTFNEFNNNLTGGVYILSDGAITANEITANDNLGLGAFFVNNSNPAVPQNVTLNGYGEFNRNSVRGLEVQSFGVITLNNIYADSNLSEGFFIDNFTGATMAKAVTIKGYVTAYNNSGTGLFIHSLGAITIANLDADNNNNGAVINNSSASIPASVTITGNALTSNNTINGMTINSKGAITINVTDADGNDNDGYGWYLNNNFSGSVGGVTLTPTASLNVSFIGNGGFGLLVQTRGIINITNLVANENGSFGAELNNAYSGTVGTVTITNLKGNNTFFDNGGTGLSVFSNRMITITNLYAENNSGNGVYLDNTSSGAASPQPITINGNGQFYGNGDNGLAILTYGAITTNNLTAYNNGQNLDDDTTPTGWGAYLNNYLGTATSAKPVNLNGTNSFSGNFQDGLYIVSLGSIKINNLTASLNGADGALLDNQWNFGVLGITLTGSNLFENNGSDGLVIYSNGAITANNVSANLNTDDGAYLDNYSLTGASANVTLTGTNNFLHNGDLTSGGGNGLVVWSDSTITINNLTANWNEGDGAYFNNYDYWFTSSVIALPNFKLTGVNSFNGNGNWGLYIDSHGAVDLTKVTADNNDAGVYVGADGNIVLTCGSMTNNTGFGLSISSFGTVTLKGVFATGNGSNLGLLNGTLVTVRACPLP